MKFDLYDKVVDVLKELRETPGYGDLVYNYKTTLTADDRIYIFRGVPENKIMEIRDEHTIIDYIGFSDYPSAWMTLADIFTQGLEEKLGHKVEIKKRSNAFMRTKGDIE